MYYTAHKLCLCTIISLISAVLSLFQKLKGLIHSLKKYGFGTSFVRLISEESKPVNARSDTNKQHNNAWGKITWPIIHSSAVHTKSNANLSYFLRKVCQHKSAVHQQQENCVWDWGTMLQADNKWPEADQPWAVPDRMFSESLIL